jgi:hypothetical protein
MKLHEIFMISWSFFAIRYILCEGGFVCVENSSKVFEKMVIPLYISIKSAKIISINVQGRNSLWLRPKETIKGDSLILKI